MSLSQRDRELIAAAYEVDAAKCRKHPTRNPFLRIWFNALAGFLESRAKSIRATR